MRSLSPAGADLIKSFEGLRLQAYDDGVGVWTIGWGHTKDVKRGQVITRAKAEELFAEDVRIFERGVNRLVEVELKQNEYDALVSFAFNVGLGAFEQSRLLAHINQSQMVSAAREFPKWIHGGGRVLPGLLRRRKQERDMFEGMRRERDLSPREIQIALNNEMGIGLLVDGVIGSQTISAIKNFQAAHGLEPDGIVGPKTLDALRGIA